MLPEKLIPTRLVFPSERPPIVLEPLRPPSRLRPFLLLFGLVHLWLLALWLRLTLRFTPARYARRVRAFLLQLGPVGRMLGQLLAMRSDLIPAEFAAELAVLEERGTGVPFDLIRQVVERELHKPLESHFEEFHEVPFTATTSFQLHRARLRREGVWVAVKVLRPHIEETTARDLALLRRLTGWLQLLRVYPKMRWSDLWREVAEVSTRELDLRFEAASLRHLRRTLPPHGVYVPDIYPDYSTRRVLVMEFIHAALLADYAELKRTDPHVLDAWLKENNIRPRRLARRLFHSVWRQILEDNYFHTDLTPYNVILLRDSRLAVIDCRGVGMFEMETLAKHRRFVESIAEGEYATAAEFSFLLSSRLPVVDLGEVKAQFVRLWRQWETRNYVPGLPAAEKSLTRMLDGLNRIMFRYHFEAQWGMARFARTLINAEVSILQLADEVNYLIWLRRYLRAAERRNNRINVRELSDRAVITAMAALELPKLMSADSIAQQEVLRRQARVFHGSTTKTGYLLGTLYGALASAWLLVGALLTCAFLDQHYQTPLEPMLGPQLLSVVRALPPLSYGVWVGVLLVVLYLYRRLIRLKRGVLQTDAVQRPEARPAI
ncbi:MAG TPA: AarF/ABC1/UbiB kinase family protein [Gemmataceae bacterium]|jgi:ubiquinone biosynthesis protein